MLSFATEFPLARGTQISNFLDVIHDWRLGSPHNAFSEDDLAPLLTGTACDITSRNDRLQMVRTQAGAEEMAAIRFTNTTPELEWRTEIAFWRTPDASQVAIRVTSESPLPARSLQEAKKPVVVRQLLDRLGGDIDGELRVGATAHRLREEEADLAARLLLGSAECRLPVAYVSCPFPGVPGVDVNALAHELAGLAHVVVEPSRAFSRRLMMLVGGQNAYGGALGLYWPKSGAAPTLFLQSDFDEERQLRREASAAVRRALLNQRPTHNCTWFGVTEISSRATYERLKETGSRELEEYIRIFDEQNSALAQQLAEAEQEISRLKEVIAEFKREYVKRSGVHFDPGAEQDLYASEIRDILLDALRAGIDQVQSGSRRQHVLQAVVDTNAHGGEALRLREQLKRLLRGYEGMNGKLKGALQEMGFEVEQGGKHIKLVFRGDDRYTFPLATTPGAYTGSLNGVSDINKRLF